MALAPDLYGGKKTTEPDEAGKEMMALQIPKATKDMSGAVDELLRRSSGGRSVWSGSAWAGASRSFSQGATRRRGGLCPVLRADPMAGCSPRLLGDVCRQSSVTTPATTSTSPPKRPRGARRSAEGSRQGRDYPRLRERRPCVLQRHETRGLRRRMRPDRLDPHVAFLHARLADLEPEREPGRERDSMTRRHRRFQGAVGDYIELGLALGRHIDGLVDAYYGPARVAARVSAEPVTDPGAAGLGRPGPSGSDRRRGPARRASRTMSSRIRRARAGAGSAPRS